MSDSSFEIRIESYIAHLAINKPEKSNALNFSDWMELKKTLDHLSTNPKVRVVIISGNAKNFSAGMDLTTLLQIPQELAAKDENEKQSYLLNFIKQLQSSVSAIEKCTKPVLACIHGACIGGAVDLITACDMRYCSADAYFTIKEIDLGIIADMGTLQRLPKIVSAGVANEWAYTGRKIFADEAKQTGLVNEVYDSKEEMMLAIYELAKQIASKSPKTIRGIKETLRYARAHSIESGLEQIAVHNSKHLINEELMEAMQAQMEKRKPNFKES